MAFTAYEQRFVARTPRVPVPPPAPRPFDRARALRTFDRVTKRVYPTDWSAAGIAPGLGRDEAIFWLYAISGINAARDELLRARGAAQPSEGIAQDVAHAHARAELERLDLTQPPPRAAIAERLAAAAQPPWYQGSYREIVIALAALLTLPALLETILDEANDDAAAAIAAEEFRRLAAWSSARADGWITMSLATGDGIVHLVTSEMQAQGSEREPVPQPLPEPVPETPFAILRHRGRSGVGERAWLLQTLAAGFASYVAPYLDDASFEQARTVVRPAIRRALARPLFAGEEHQRTQAFSPACYLAASLHLTDEVEAIVASWSHEISTAQRLAFLPEIVYGLRTPDAVVEESRTLALALASPPAIRDWLATTGEAGAGYACEQLAVHATEATADAFVAAIAALDAPSLPATILRLTAIPVLYVSARTWLEANFDRALPALAAATGASTPGTTAGEIVRRFARRGHPGASAALGTKGPTP